MDILVLIPGDKRPKINVPHWVHVHFEKKERFAHNFLEGDDYSVSAIRFGKLLYDRSSFWKTLQHQLENAKWPNWVDKIGYAERRIKIGDKVLETGDPDAATEEYLFAATHIARMLLLRRGIYPFSRPELSQQLVAIGQYDLAADISNLIMGGSETEDLRRISSRLKMALDSERTEIDVIIEG